MSFLVLFTYQTFFSKPTPVPATKRWRRRQRRRRGTGQRFAGEVDAAAPAAPTVAALVGETSERDVTIDTPHVIAMFTNRGARLKSWKLKEYRDRNGDPLELIDASLAATQPLPFSLSVPDAATTAMLNTSLYAVHEAKRRGGRRPPGVVRIPDRSRTERHQGVHPQSGSFTVVLRLQVSPGRCGAHADGAVGTGPRRQRLPDRTLRGEARGAVLDRGQGEPDCRREDTGATELRPGLRVRRHRRSLLRGIRGQPGTREGRVPAAADPAAARFEGSGSRSRGVLD